MALQPTGDRITSPVIIGSKTITHAHRRARQCISSSIFLAWVIYNLQVELLQLFDPMCASQGQRRLILHTN